MLDKTACTPHAGPMPTDTTITFQVTVARTLDAPMLARLLYDDVKIHEQWETEDKVAILWQRESPFLNTYQRDRLSSAWLPTYQGLDALHWMVDELGLNIPCAQ